MSASVASPAHNTFAEAALGRLAWLQAEKEVGDNGHVNFFDKHFYFFKIGGVGREEVVETRYIASSLSSYYLGRRIALALMIWFLDFGELNLLVGGHRMWRPAHVLVQLTIYIYISGACDHHCVELTDFRNLM